MNSARGQIKTWIDLEEDGTSAFESITKLLDYSAKASVFKQVKEKIPKLFLKYQYFYIRKWGGSAWPIEQNWAFMFLIINSH